MLKVYTHYVMWIPRKHRHQGGSAEADIVSPQPQPSIMSSGDTFQGPWASPSISWVGGSATFAFWSITGGINGSIVTTDNTPPPTIVGNTDIMAKAWYISIGGVPDVPGIFIDAFDVNQGIFVDDYFVDVVTNPSLTAAANEDGFVPTAQAEDIKANPLIKMVPFHEWTIVLEIAIVEKKHPTVNHDILHAALKCSAVVFAFYQTPTGEVSNVPHPHYEIGTWVSWGVKVDAGGLTGHGPVPPWTPFVQQFVAGLALADAASKVSPKLRTNVLNIAAEQLTIATEAIKKEIQSAKK